MGQSIFHVILFLVGELTFTSQGSRPSYIDMEGNNKDVEDGRRCRLGLGPVVFNEKCRKCNECAPVYMKIIRFVCNSSSLLISVLKCMRAWLDGFSHVSVCRLVTTGPRTDTVSGLRVSVGNAPKVKLIDSKSISLADAINLISTYLKNNVLKD